MSNTETVYHHNYADSSFLSADWIRHIKHTLSRGFIVKHHAHKYREDCNSKCRVFHPGDEVVASSN